MTETAGRWDVIAVNIKTGVRRILDTDKSAANADAIVMMAVARLGVETEFFKMVPRGSEDDAS